MLLAIFQKTLTWQIPLFQNDLTFSKNKEPSFISNTKVFQKKIIKLMGIYNPTILQSTILQTFDQWISNTFERT
jgi:hypothetical protein